RPENPGIQVRLRSRIRGRQQPASHAEEQTHGTELPAEVHPELQGEFPRLREELAAAAGVELRLQRRIVDAPDAEAKVADEVLVDPSLSLHSDEDRRKTQRLRPDLRAAAIPRGRSAERVPLERDESPDGGRAVPRLEVGR